MRSAASKTSTARGHALHNPWILSGALHPGVNKDDAREARVRYIARRIWRARARCYSSASDRCSRRARARASAESKASRGVLYSPTAAISPPPRARERELAAPVARLSPACLRNRMLCREVGKVGAHLYTFAENPGEISRSLNAERPRGGYPGDPGREFRQWRAAPSKQWALLNIRRGWYVEREAGGRYTKGNAGV